MYREPLDANEWQEGQYGSSWQVRALMAGVRGHLRAMWLLPFGAAVAVAAGLLLHLSARDQAAGRRCRTKRNVS